MDGAPERRSRLRQYQAQLLERMQAARGADGGRELGVLLGTRRCLLDLAQLGEIAPPQAPLPVPYTCDWYLGLVNIRGVLTGVVDLERYLGGAAAPGAGRLVTLAPRLGYNCALLAARVLGLRRLDQLHPAPAREGDPAWLAGHYTDADQQSWMRIDLARLVAEPRFAQAGLAPAA